MKALHTYVIFEEIQEELHKTVLLTSEKPKNYKAKVISVGDRCVSLTVGDTIIIPRYADTLVMEGKEYSICKEEDITATL